MCKQENVAVDPGVLALVVRAGAGSVRDSLSVLDQLIGGAESDTLTYERAVQLLGFTPATLLDEISDAIADSDGAAMFGVVEKVIDAGLDPERFMKDLLERLRDLVIIAAVDDAFEKRLIVASDDQRDRLQSQADRIGLAALTRSTELVALALTELKGPTAPRLQLELVCAKLLLPGAHGDELSLAARLERMERRMAIASTEAAGSGTQASAVAAPAPARASAPAPARRERAKPAPAQPAAAPQPLADEPAKAAEVVEPPETGSSPKASADKAKPASSGLDRDEVRRLWPSVLDRIKTYRRVTWAQLFEKSDVLEVDDRQLTLAVSDVGAFKAFSQGGHDEIVRQALIDVVGPRRFGRRNPRPIGLGCGIATDPRGEA